jgi:dienelactone hydrolase
MTSFSRDSFRRLNARAPALLATFGLVAVAACARTPAPASANPTSEPAQPAASASVATAAEVPSGAAAAPAAPPITTQEVTYTDGKTELRGYLAAPTKAGPLPGVLVVHEWWGQNDYVQRRARMLAELGYVALAVDMYGVGKTTTDPKEAGKLSQAAFSDVHALKAKFLAARELLAKDARVDSTKIGAVGYCFGGGVILNMMRLGVPLDVAASFHGSLKAAQPLKKGLFAGTVLIETGDADPMVPLSDVEAIRAELTQAGVPFQVDVHPGAQHAFTNPRATEVGKQYGLPIAYDPVADAKSWQTLTETFNKVWAAK